MNCGEFSDWSNPLIFPLLWCQFQKIATNMYHQIISSGLGNNIPPFPIVIDMKQFNY